MPESEEGVCPNCGEPIIDHDDQARKRCHDAVSGYRRSALCSPTYDRQPFDDQEPEDWEYGHEGHGYWGAH